MSKIKKCLIITLILVEIFTFTLTIKSFDNKNEVYKKEENIVDNKQFAIYVENNEGNYEEYTSSNNFPSSGYKFNSTKSECLDMNNNTIEGILSYSDGKITVTSNKTSYCYVYFDLEPILSNLCSSGETVGSCLIDNNSEIDNLDDTSYGGMYRYTGTDELVNDNYICFGTSDKDECINNTDQYLYRVIGVQSEANSTLGLDINQLKVIKTDSIGTSQWHSSYKVNTTWNTGGTDAALYTYLNSTVLNDTSIIPSGWSSKIDSVKWYVGDGTSYTNASTVSGYEDDTVTSSTSKIGLMYLSDYFYAYTAGGDANCGSALCSSWMTLGSDEWTMTRYGYYSGADDYFAWCVVSSGYVGGSYQAYIKEVRPSFYLNADEVYISGNGTIDDPIILGDPQDTTAPTVTASVSGNNSTSAKLSITSNEAGTYCVNTNGTANNVSNCVFSGSISANTAVTTGAFTETGTYYAHVKDAAGNYGVSSAVSVTVSQPAGETIIAQNPTGLETTTAYNGMYRYTGTSANNYVSIGGVSYRIIGITSTANSTLGLEAGQLKVIKTNSVGTYQWHSSDDYLATSVTWLAQAAVYTYLNSTVLNDTSIIPSGWSSKIDNVKWCVGDVKSYTNASTIVGLETSTITSSTAKIGLMYLSDYYYAYTAGGTTDCHNNACLSWLTLNSNEWTMTRYGQASDGYYNAWNVYSNGYVDYTYMTTTYAVRPIFYLTSDVQYVSGTGTESDPFILQ